MLWLTLEFVEGYAGTTRAISGGLVAEGIVKRNGDYYNVYPPSFEGDDDDVPDGCYVERRSNGSVFEALHLPVCTNVGLDILGNLN